MLLIRIAEENTVRVTINNPNPDFSAFVDSSIDCCPAKSGSGVGYWQTVEREYCCPHDAITSIENDLDSLAYNVVQLALLRRKRLVLCYVFVVIDPQITKRSYEKR